ncbi:MAG: hypothetical protein IJC57_03420 [Clostridia bacterium]|nr:hypothetical protein [Clostridia bacterium]
MNLKNVKKSDVIKILHEHHVKIIVIIGALGILLVLMSNVFSKSSQKNNNINSKIVNLEEKRVQLEQNLEKIISSIHGAGKAKILITFENNSEIIYATEEKINKLASEDKSNGEITRKKETDDCERKFMTIKDSNGAEKAVVLTEIEPKVKGVLVICPGGDDVLVKKRIIEAVTTVLNINSTHVCVTKSN